VTIPAAVAPLFLEFPALDGRIWTLAIARLIVTAGFAMVMPFLAMHLAVDRGIPVLQIGLLWTVVGAISASMQWLSGQVGDRIGRRPVILAAMVVRSLNLVAMGYAIAADSSFFTIGVLCVVNGASRAFYDPVASAVLASLTSPEERVAAFSLHRVGSSLGWAAGPLMATFAADVPYALLFYVCGPLTLIAALAMATIRETRPEKPPKKLALSEVISFRRDKPFVRFLWATAAFYLLQTQMYHIMAIYAAKYLGLNRAQVATLFTLNGILVVLVQLPAVRFIRRVGTMSALIIGSFGYFVSYLGCCMAIGYFSLLACVALITLCEIMALPAQQTAVTDMAPPNGVSQYAGVYGLVQGAAQTVGPIFGTSLIEFVSARGAWIILAVLGLAAAFGYSTVGRRPVRETANV
jgi:MFS family permease